MRKPLFTYLISLFSIVSFGQDDTINKKQFENIFGDTDLHSVDSIISVSKIDSRLFGKWDLKEVKTYSGGALIQEESFQLTKENNGFIFEKDFQGHHIIQGDTNHRIIYWGITSKKDSIKIFQLENRNVNNDYRLVLSAEYGIEKISRNRFVLSRRSLSFTTKYTRKRIYKKELFIFRRVR
ncbi:MAG: hypothetical protein COA32_05240 [Fluviicola sp.]|nr:MAG: hypothetical protein COA32_05240 [Fluviicola sp.]